MDEVDKFILQRLKRDSRTSFTKIAAELKLSEGAVRKRIGRLQRNGIIKRFTIEVKKEDTIRCFMLASVDTKVPNPRVAKDILEISNVERVYELAGEYDLLILFSSSSIDDINKSIDKVRDVPGVDKTNTIVSLKEWA